MSDEEDMFKKRDIVARGGKLDVETLVKNYKIGVFVWPEDADSELLWCLPESRGVLFFDKLRVDSDTSRLIRRRDFTVKFNTAFDQVIRACAAQPRKESDNWISPEIIRSYNELHQAGFAHSVECWQDGQLVGGLYGTFIDGVYNSESMFYKKSNASKIAFVYEVEMLKHNGIAWMDTQMVTPTTGKFGAEYIPNSEYQELLKNAQSQYNSRGRPELEFVTPTLPSDNN